MHLPTSVSACRSYSRTGLYPVVPFHLPVRHHQPPCHPTHLPDSFFVHRSWIGLHPMDLHLHKFIDQSWMNKSLSFLNLSWPHSHSMFVSLIMTLSHTWMMILMWNFNLLILSITSMVRSTRLTNFTSPDLTMHPPHSVLSLMTVI